MKHGQKIVLSVGLALGGIAMLGSTTAQHLSGQAAPQINVFSAVESGNGVTLRADEHNIVSCNEASSSAIATGNLERSSFRFWVYEYSGLEPQQQGKFYISPGEIAIHPEYGAIDTLRTFAGGKRYYIMSAVDLQFRCGQGLSKPGVCGDGILDRGEVCDTEGAGCNQRTCTAANGYVCTANVCSIFIPNPAAEDSPQHTNTSVIHEESTVMETASESSSNTAIDPSTEQIVESVQQTTQAEVLPLTIQVTDANMDPEGMPVPSGVYPLGIFRFATESTAVSSASLESILFSVETANVVIGAQEFRFYTPEHPEQKIACTTLYSSGDPFMSQQISGKFIVRCSNLASGGMATTISNSAYVDGVLEGNVVQPKLSNAAVSSVQISVERMGQQNGMFGIHGSRTEWTDENGQQPAIQILPALEPVRSTKYAS